MAGFVLPSLRLPTFALPTIVLPTFPPITVPTVTTSATALSTCNAFTSYQFLSRYAPAKTFCDQFLCPAITDTTTAQITATNTITTTTQQTTTSTLSTTEIDTLTSTLTATSLFFIATIRETIPSTTTVTATATSTTVVTVTSTIQPAASPVDKRDACIVKPGFCTTYVSTKIVPRVLTHTTSCTGVSSGLVHSEVASASKSLPVYAAESATQSAPIYAVQSTLSPYAAPDQAPDYNVESTATTPVYKSQTTASAYAPAYYPLPSGTGNKLQSSKTIGSYSMTSTAAVYDDEDPAPAYYDDGSSTPSYNDDTPASNYDDENPVPAYNDGETATPAYYSPSTGSIYAKKPYGTASSCKPRVTARPSASVTSMASLTSSVDPLATLYSSLTADPSASAACACIEASPACTTATSTTTTTSFTTATSTVTQAVQTSITATITSMITTNVTTTTVRTIFAATTVNTLPVSTSTTTVTDTITSTTTATATATPTALDCGIPVSFGNNLISQVYRIDDAYTHPAICKQTCLEADNLDETPGRTKGFSVTQDRPDSCLCVMSDRSTFTNDAGSSSIYYDIRCPVSSPSATTSSTTVTARTTSSTAATATPTSSDCGVGVYLLRTADGRSITRTGAYAQPSLCKQTCLEADISNETPGRFKGFTVNAQNPDTCLCISTDKSTFTKDANSPDIYYDLGCPFSSASVTSSTTTVTATTPSTTTATVSPTPLVCGARIRFSSNLQATKFYVAGAYTAPNGCKQVCLRNTSDANRFKGFITNAQFINDCSCLRESSPDPVQDANNPNVYYDIGCPFSNASVTASTTTVATTTTSTTTATTTT